MSDYWTLFAVGMEVSDIIFTGEKTTIYRKSSSTINKSPKKWENQEKCRKSFEEVFYPKKFPSSRPDWLKNPLTGQNLELDGYNKELNIAFEYDGKQHHEYVKHFHKDKKDWKYQQEKDLWKDNKCRENCVNLIRIPYTIKKKDIDRFIFSELIKKKLIENRIL